MEEILDAADGVFAEVGYEAATTNQIAARAGISPGSLYQYFANKPAIARALADRYVLRLGELDAFLLDPATAALPVEQVVDRIVDRLIAFHRAHPGARSLTAADPSPELAASTRGLHDVLCGRVETVIGDRAPHLARRDRALAATVSIQIFAALLPSVIAATPGQRRRVTRELKAAVAGYWSTLDRATLPR
jgi:AcrR family transcriptional regulator